MKHVNRFPLTGSGAMTFSVVLFRSTGTDTSTDGCNILHTLLVKHYNDLLDRQSSERGKDEVTYFYVGDVFCITK